MRIKVDNLHVEIVGINLIHKMPILSKYHKQIDTSPKKTHLTTTINKNVETRLTLQQNI